MVTSGDVSRGDVFLVHLNPTRGAEIHNARPCVVVSPDETNSSMRTFVVAPMTTGAHAYAFRVPCRFAGKSGHVVADQLRTVDRDRMIRKLGRLSPTTMARVLAVLQEMFAP